MWAFSSVHSLSRVWLFMTPWTAMSGFPVHHQLPELAQTHVHRVSDAIQPSFSVVPFSSHLQSFPVSRSFPMSQFLTSGGQSIGVSASASVLPMNVQDWFPLGCLLAVQGTLKSLLQHRSSKESILWHSAFFIVQLSHPYMTTGKTIALTRWTFFGKVMSLLSLKRALCLWGSYRTRPPRRNPSNFTKWGKGWFVY